LRHTPHRARAPHRAEHPVHVTLRSSVRSLRSQYVVRTVLGALRESSRERFRIVHYSVHANHLHLIVEAKSKEDLSNGMRGLAVRVARRVNKLLFRRGRFWADRWHGHTLKSPRQVRNALVYVLQNHKRHSPSKLVPELDAHSSAEWFDGFSAPIPSSFRSIGPPRVVSPHSWLLRIGWLRHGRVRASEVPRSAHQHEP
jgi:putative transposase